MNGSREVTPPRVTNIAFISSPERSDTYQLGETVEVVVEFDGAVKATGDPRLALTVGPRTRYATFSGWGSDALYFSYTVQAGDRDEDGIGIAANALELSGGTITAADGVTEAVLTHAAMAPAGAGKVSSSEVTPPRVREIRFAYAPARDGTYELGETVEVEVEFDRAVEATGDPQVALIIGTQTRYATFLGWGSETLYFAYTVREGDRDEFDRVVMVTGSPRVALTIGTQTRYAAYLAWSGEDRHLHFSYAVQESDRDERGIGIPANALEFNGGTITSVGGATDADLTHRAVAGAPVFKVSGGVVTAPAVTAIYLDNHVPPPTGDTYVRGERIRVWVEFDKEVTATGSPRVALTIGDQTRHADYSGFSVAVTPDGGRIVNKDVLSFDYFVQATDRDEDGVGIPANALALDGGTIKHAGAATTDADLAHDAAPADPTRKVDGSRIAP